MLSVLQKCLNLSYRATIQAVLAFALFSLPFGASAEPRNITESEWSLLPRYCPNTLAYSPTTSSGYKHWESRMGMGFKHMHHYCWAQIGMIRAMKAGVSTQTRQALREGARSDYEYVIYNTKPDFIMLPEVYTRLGEVELLLKRPDKANEAFARARQLKPDYWPAYSQWAEFLIRFGKKEEARHLLRNGLEYSPTAKVLIEQYRLVGGDPSGIVPKEKRTEPQNDAPSPDLEAKPSENKASDTTEDAPSTTKTLDR